MPVNGCLGTDDVWAACIIRLCRISHISSLFAASARVTSARERHLLVAVEGAGMAVSAIGVGLSAATGVGEAAGVATADDVAEAAGPAFACNTLSRAVASSRGAILRRLTFRPCGAMGASVVIGIPGVMFAPAAISPGTVLGVPWGAAIAAAGLCSGAACGSWLMAGSGAIFVSGGTVVVGVIAIGVAVSAGVIVMGGVGARLASA